MKINDIHSKMLRWDTILSAELAHGKFGLSVHGSYKPNFLVELFVQHHVALTNEAFNLQLSVDCNCYTVF